MPSDAVLTDDYDLQIDENGDIKTADFFDTAILYSLFGERRANEHEVLEPQFRRGWIGNGDDFENGSKLWLFEQARLTRSNLNRIEDEAKKGLQWLVDDGYAAAINQPRTVIIDGRVLLEVVIRRTRDKVERRLFELWENTGNAA